MLAGLGLFDGFVDVAAGGAADEHGGEADDGKQHGVAEEDGVLVLLELFDADGVGGEEALCGPEPRPSQSVVRGLRLRIERRMVNGKSRMVGPERAA